LTKDGLENPLNYYHTNTIAATVTTVGRLQWLLLYYIFTTMRSY